jgi:hypothetical protein
MLMTMCCRLKVRMFDGPIEGPGQVFALMLGTVASMAQLPCTSLSE